MSEYDKKQIQSGLDEIRRLNLRKQELEKTIKLLERDVEIKTKSLKTMEAEIGRASEAAKTARKEAADAVINLSQARKEQEAGRRDLELQAKAVAKQQADLDAKIAQDIEILTQCNASKSNAKEASQKAQIALTEAKQAQAAAEAIKAEYAPRLEALKASVLAHADQVSKFNAEKQALFDDITASKNRLSQDMALVLAAKKEHEKAISSAAAAQENAHVAEKECRELMKRVDARDEQLRLAENAIQKEKAELVTTKKQLELDRLRLEKLAHDKGIDKELEELRKKQ